MDDKLKIAVISSRLALRAERGQMDYPARIKNTAQQLGTLTPNKYEADIIILMHAEPEDVAQLRSSLRRSESAGALIAAVLTIEQTLDTETLEKFEHYADITFTDREKSIMLNLKNSLTRTVVEKKRRGGEGGRAWLTKL